MMRRCVYQPIRNGDGCVSGGLVPSHVCTVVDECVSGGLIPSHVCTAVADTRTLSLVSYERTKASNAAVNAKDVEVIC